jgi:hypothetical protein
MRQQRLNFTRPLRRQVREDTLCYVHIEQIIYAHFTYTAL